MFSGQFSKRKQVNLGGQSKTVDRASALAEARREREQRSRERARASAAVLLQAWFRRVRAVLAVKRQVAACVEESLRQLPTSSVSDIVQVDHVLPTLVRQVLFTHHMPEHSRHVDHVLRLVHLEQRASSDAEQAGVALPLYCNGWLGSNDNAPMNEAQRLIQVRKLASQAIASFPEDASQLESALLRLQFVATAESLQTNDTRRDGTRLWDSSNVPILRFVTNLIHRVEHEREEPHADVLRANLNQAWNALIHILVPYLAEADTAAASQQFVLGLLSIRQLVHLVDPTTIIPLIRTVHVFPSQLEALSEPLQLMGLLENISYLTRVLDWNAYQDDMEGIFWLLEFLIREVPTEAATKSLSRSTDNSEYFYDYDDEDELPDAEGVELTITGQVQRTLQNELVEFIPHLARLSTMLSTSKGDVLSNSQIAICRLCHTLIKQATIRTKVLEVLASTAPSFVRTLWHMLESSRDSLMEFVSRGKTGSHSLIPIMFSLFCSVYSYLLSIIDDNEFFEKQSFFSMTDNLSVAFILKELMVTYYWRLVDSSGQFIYSDIDADLGSNATVLVHHLYTRDSRRPFVPKGEWVSLEIPGRVVIEEDLAAEPRGQRIISEVPFLIPLEDRLKLFFKYAAAEKRNHHFWGHRLKIKIRRGSVFEDAYSQLAGLEAEGWLESFRVEFWSREGYEEPGVDGGGLYKEFLNLLVGEGFGAEHGLFVQTSQKTLYPNPFSATAHTSHLQFFRFLGCVLAKCLHDSVLVELPLAKFFLSKLLGKHNNVNDLYTLDPELHRHLMFLKNYDGDVERDLELDFTVTQHAFGEVQTVELIPGGSHIPVTESNRYKYIFLLANYRLNQQIKQQCEAFLRGFHSIIPASWICMFNEHELQYLISGVQGPIDLENLRANTVYQGYSETDDTIRFFWQALDSFTPAEQRDFLKFVTSSSNSPLLGFENLYPKFAIARSHTDDTLLPTAATCMNLLKLPVYNDYDTLREKLLYAITSGTGFEMS